MNAIRNFEYKIFENFKTRVFVENQDSGAREKSVKSVQIESGQFFPTTKRSNAVHQVGFSCTHRIRTHHLLQYDQSAIADNQSTCSNRYKNTRTLSNQSIDWRRYQCESIGFMLGCQDTGSRIILSVRARYLVIRYLRCYQLSTTVNTNRVRSRNIICLYALIHYPLWPTDSTATAHDWSSK